MSKVVLNNFLFKVQTKNMMVPHTKTHRLALIRNKVLSENSDRVISREANVYLEFSKELVYKKPCIGILILSYQNIFVANSRSHHVALSLSHQELVRKGKPDA